MHAHQFIEQQSLAAHAVHHWLLNLLPNRANWMALDAGAAYGYAFPEQGPLRAADFSVGEATVQKVLQNLGFEVRQGRPD